MALERQVTELYIRTSIFNLFTKLSRGITAPRAGETLGLWRSRMQQLFT